MQDITHQNFESELITASLAQPVLLDIWAPWCGPCKTLGPILEKLETAYAGRFKLCKLNSDEEPEIAAQLSQMFGVRSIPLCVLFSGGQPVDGFVGAVPEAEIRVFLDKHVPSAEAQEAADDVLEAEALLAEGDSSGAIERLEAAVAAAPDNATARYDYLRALLAEGRVAEARAAFDPVANDMLLDARLAAAGRWIDAMEAEPKARPPEALQSVLTANKRDFDARFELAQRHFAAGEFTAAMDELLEIVMRDKAWKDEAARKTYVAILELMSKPPAKAKAAAPTSTLELSGKSVNTSSDPVVDSYRRKLSMALF